MIQWIFCHSSSYVHALYLKYSFLISCTLSVQISSEHPLNTELRRYSGINDKPQRNAHFYLSLCLWWEQWWNMFSRLKQEYWSNFLHWATFSRFDCKTVQDKPQKKEAKERETKFWSLRELASIFLRCHQTWRWREPMNQYKNYYAKYQI